MQKISIIVPVYNTEKEFLTECIQSAIHQTLQDLQIILVDDGSTDDSGKLCDEFAAADPRIIVHHQPNAGVSVARNNGLDIATGEYILFLDADDYLPADACERLYRKMPETGADMLLCGHTCICDGQEVPHLLGRDAVFTGQDIRKLQEVILNPAGELLNISPAGTWGKLYRRSFIVENNLRYVPGLKRMQDNVFCLNAYQVARKVAYFDYSGYYYRINASSVCNKYNPAIPEILEKALHEFEQFIHTRAMDLQPFYYCKVITVCAYEYLHIYFRNENNPATGRTRRAAYRQLLQQSPYCDAIKHVNLSLLSPRLRLSTFLLRHRMLWLLWFLLDTEALLNHILHKQRKI